LKLHPKVSISFELVVNSDWILQIMLS
jgi:hypothetical protein